MDDPGINRTSKGSIPSWSARASDAPLESWAEEVSFEQVLSQARVLDRQAIACLYRRCMPIVYRYVLARVGDIHHTEDITSDTFFAVIEQIHTTRARDEVEFIAWLLGITRHKVALHFRRRRTHPETTITLADYRHIFAH